MKKLLGKIFNASVDYNKKNILGLMNHSKDVQFLDLGCNDGEWTMDIASKIGTNNVFGVELIESRAKLSEKKGIKVKIKDLNNELPFEDEFFDVIHANQVIEHIGDLDNFMSEIYRILKKGGYVVISTENGSSWHNIIASILGWQIFSLTNISSRKLGIGNPLAIHKGEQIDLSTWTHKTIFNYLGLKDFFITYGFKKITLRGSGYYPLPAFFGNFDVRHSHFITIRAYK